MSGWFKPLRSEASPRKILAFDIEGTGERDGFICGAVVGESVNAFYTDPERMYRDLRAYALDGYWVYAHNLQYDLPILEGERFPQGELLFTRDRLLWAKYRQGKRVGRFFDSGNLFPRHSVSAIGEMVGYPKDDLPVEILRDLARGRKLHSFQPGTREIIRHYCMRDAEIVYFGVFMLQELSLALGGQLMPTISGISMDLFRRKYHKYPWPVVGPETNKLCRPAFYGGRVENFVLGQVEGANMYDITSLYPFVQSRVSYPHPNHLRLDIAPGLNGPFWRGEGVLYAQVRIPDTFVPTLPYRYNKRLFFPVGSMRGTWTILELKRALAWGAVLERIEWVLWSPVVFNPFQDFVSDLFSMRSYYLERKEGQANLVKLILNSLYGRWGLNPHGGLYQMVNLENEMDLEKMGGYTTHNLYGHLVAFGPLEVKRQPDYVNVMIAAQVASAARLYLLDELIHQGEDLLYCDTDSILTRGEIQTSPGLGGWRVEMQNGRADMIGLKEYALHNAMTGTRYVAKGVPRSVAAEYIQTGTARFFRALGIREALREGRLPSTWIETFKTHQTEFPKRYPLTSWQAPGLSYSPTRPYQARELALVTAGLYLPPVQAVQFPGLEYQREPPLEQGRLFSKEPRPGKK